MPTVCIITTQIKLFPTYLDRFRVEYGNEMITQANALKLTITCILFYLSGLAALVYQILWMKELALLFGNSTQAAAATLTAFFTGIAAGNAYWGRRASTLARPLLTYGVLEICVTLSAVIYFVVYLAYDALYPILFSLFEFAPAIFTVAKFFLALLLFFPAAFFMGGTLPVMTQHLVINRETLGKRASVLYAINTFGAASGAIVAGFYLPQALGTDNSYILAMSMTLLVGLAAIVLGRKTTPREVELSQQKASNQSTQSTEFSSVRSLNMLAVISGFASLALQVLWIRMFAQVLHNSVYTYSAILSIFLIALAIGSSIARQLAKRQINADKFLPALLTVTALLVAASPMLFYSITNGATYVSGAEDFNGYILQIFLIVAAVIGLPTIIIGVLLPYLFKLAESTHTSPGETVGRLVTVNTLGAIVGSIAAGFVLLEWIGLWASLKAIAILYVIGAVWLLIEHGSKQRAVIKLTPIVGLLLLVTILDTSKLPVVKVNAVKKNEALLKVWEGADATVAVLRRNGHLKTKLNNWYTLGGTDDMTTQQMQSHLPLLLHPNPKQVFYLGLGTGITAGTALNYKVDEVVIAEISASAILASKEFFGEHTNNLHDDRRVTVIAEDGRNVLRGSRDAYDLIISDLFIPWKAGTGTLYSKEHYTIASKRLRSDGMYVQWLPLYQLSEDEFTIIARTMQSAFSKVSLWRGNFSANRPVVALIGHNASSELSADTPLLTTSRLALKQQLNKSGDTIPLIAHYAGTFRSDDRRITSAPLNTDNNSIIEYLAPINHRREKAGQIEWFVRQQVLEFVAPYLNEDALSRDPYLSSIDPDWYDAIQAGYYLHTSHVLKNSNPNSSSEAKALYESLFIKAASALESK